jgi:hypothetical protein
VATYDTASLLANIRRRCSAPSSSPAGADDATLLALANDEVSYGLQPLLMKLRQDYFTATIDIPIVAGQAAYDIPARAIGVKLRDVGLVDSSGKFTSLDRMQIDQLDGLATTAGLPSAFYLQDTQLVLFPTPSGSGTLRVPYYARRNRLVLPSAVAVVTAVNTTTGVIGFNTLPSTIVTGTKVDLVRSTPHFRTLAIDQTATVSGLNVTVPAAAVAQLAVGDYLCVAGETAVPQLAVELHPVLAQRVAVLWMTESGSPSLQAGILALQNMEAAIVDLLSPRVDGEVEMLNSSSFYPVVE